MALPDVLPLPGPPFIITCPSVLSGLATRNSFVFPNTIPCAEGFAIPDTIKSPSVEKSDFPRTPPLSISLSRQSTATT